MKKYMSMKDVFDTFLGINPTRNYKILQEMINKGLVPHNTFGNEEQIKITRYVKEERIGNFTSTTSSNYSKTMFVEIKGPDWIFELVDAFFNRL
jgi:hypothetical protein